MKRIIGVLLCLLVVFVMSHNTSALNFVATDTRAYNFNNSAGVGAWLTNNEGTQYLLHGGASPSLVYSIDGAANIGIPTNTSRINGFQLGFMTQTPTKYIINVAYRFCPTNPDQLKSWIGFSSNAYNAIVEQDFVVNGSCITGSVSAFGSQSRWYVQLGYTGSGLTTGNVSAGGSFIFQKANFIVLGDDADYSSVLNAIKNNTDDIKDLLEEVRDSADEALDREQDAGEEQSEAAQDAADDSQDSVDGATTSLFSAIGSVITAIKDTNATDCIIDITTAQYTIGNVNLCQAPQGILNMVQALAALVIVPMVLMAAYSLLHKMYNAFKEVQDT